MAVTSYRIEAFFDAHDLKYYRRMDESDSGSWLLLFGSQTAITIRLMEDGECLLFRSLPIIDLSEVKPRNRAKVHEQLLARNDGLVVGHYSGSAEVHFEMTLPIEDGDVTDNQLGRILSTVSREVSRFGATIRALARGEKITLEEDFALGDATSPDDLPFPETPDAAGIEDLMQRLFDPRDDDADEGSA